MTTTSPHSDPMTTSPLPLPCNCASTAHGCVDAAVMGAMDSLRHSLVHFRSVADAKYLGFTDSVMQRLDSHSQHSARQFHQHAVGVANDRREFKREMRRTMLAVQGQVNDWCLQQSRLVDEFVASSPRSANHHAVSAAKTASASVDQSDLIAALEQRIFALETNQRQQQQQSQLPTQSHQPAAIDSEVAKQVDELRCELMDQKQTLLDSQLRLIELSESNHADIQQLKQQQQQQSLPPPQPQPQSESSGRVSELEAQLCRLQEAFDAQRAEFDSHRTKMLVAIESIGMNGPNGSVNMLPPATSPSSSQSANGTAPLRRSLLKKSVHFSEEFNGRLFQTETEEDHNASNGSIASNDDESDDEFAYEYTVTAYQRQRQLDAERRAEAEKEWTFDANTLDTSIDASAAISSAPAVSAPALVAATTAAAEPMIGTAITAATGPAALSVDPNHDTIEAPIAESMDVPSLPVQVSSTGNSTVAEATAAAPMVTVSASAASAAAEAENRSLSFSDLFSESNASHSFEVPSPSAAVVKPPTIPSIYDKHDSDIESDSSSEDEDEPQLTRSATVSLAPQSSSLLTLSGPSRGKSSLIVQRSPAASIRASPAAIVHEEKQSNASDDDSDDEFVAGFSLSSLKHAGDASGSIESTPSTGSATSNINPTVTKGGGGSGSTDLSVRDEVLNVDDSSDDEHYDDDSIHFDSDDDVLLQ